MSQPPIQMQGLNLAREIAAAQAAVDEATDAASLAQAQANLAAASAQEAEDLIVSDLGTTDGQTRALIQAPASQTAQALSASSADSISGTPSSGLTPQQAVRKVAGPRVLSPRLQDSAYIPPREYDARSNTYNLTGSNWRRARMALAAARAGAGLCRVAVVGDSIAAGWGSTPNNQVSKNAWPQLMREAAVGRLGIPTAGTGHVMAGQRGVYGSSYPDDRWTGNWTTLAVADNSVGFGFITTSSGKVQTFTTDKPGTVAEFSYTTRTGWGQFSVTVKNSSGTTIAGPTTYNSDTGAASPGASVQVVSLPGLTLDVGSTIVFTSLNASVNCIMSAGVRNTSGLLVHNLGVGTASTSTWNQFAAPALTTSPQSQGWFTKGLLGGNVDILLIALGTNDATNANSGVTPAAFAANLANIVSQLRGTNTDVALVHPPPSNISGNPNLWINGSTNGYTSDTFYKQADTLGVPLVDISDRWGDFATANAMGMEYDLVHPTTAGHHRHALDVLNLLAA